MSLRFLFSFARGAEPVEIPYLKLAAEHQSLGRLRAHIEASVRAAEERAGKVPDEARVRKLADGAFAGFLARCLRGFGEQYVERVVAALERISRARENIGDQLDRALKGELPDFAKIRESFNEIDAAFPEVIDPESATPPHAPMVGEGVPLTAKPRTWDGLLKLADERLQPGARGALERANELAPDALREVLDATDWSKQQTGVRPKNERPQVEGLIAKLMDRLRAKGITPEEEAHLRRAIEEFSLPDEQRQAIDNAIDAIGTEQLPNAGGLRAALRRSATLRARLGNPDRLRALWRAFDSKDRNYSFERYCWFLDHHVRGALGEWTTAFELGRGGLLLFLKGPKESVTTGGTDMLVVDVLTKQVYAIDNKATLKSRVLARVTALMRNFSQNLAEDIRDVRAALGERSEPNVESVLRRMESAERQIVDIEGRLGLSGEAKKRALDANVEVTLANGKRMPVQEAITEVLREHDISRMVTNSGGVLERMTTALEDAGIELENMN